MTFDDFRKATSSLEAFYEKALNPTQVQLWYEEIKDYPLEKYVLAIKKICKTSQYKPTLSTVLEALRNIRQEVETDKEKVECKACKGTGYVLYKKIENGLTYEYACQCNCANGIGLDYDGRKIADKEHRSQYYLAKAEDIFLKGGVT